MDNPTLAAAQNTGSEVKFDRHLALRAGALLLDAAGMLRMEAGEWRSRKKEQPKVFAAMTDSAWADKCERIAKTNESAASAMIETANKIAAATA